MTNHTTTSPVTILLIEDEHSVAAFVAAALRRRGYHVVTAASGAEGLEQLANGHFSGIISDVRMPGQVNGAQVHEWVREHRPELAQRMLLMSGDTANLKTQTLLANSGLPFIEKPFRVQDFISVVENTFGKP